MRRFAAPRLSFGTGVERSTPESLTRGQCGFVHGDMWFAFHRLLQDRDACRSSPPLERAELINAGPAQASTATSRRPPHAVQGGVRCHAGAVSQCATMRWPDRTGLSIGTSLERKAPESLTRGQCGFVHGDIWQPASVRAQDRVAGRDSKGFLSLPKVNAARSRLAPKSQWRSGGLLGLCAAGGGARRRGGGDELVGFEHDMAHRGRPLGTERGQHAGAGNRHQPDLDVAQLGEIFDGAA